MKKKFGFLMLLLSAAGAALGWTIWILLVGSGIYSTTILSVLLAIVFFVGMLLLGFGGMRLAIWLTRNKYRIDTAGTGKRLIAVVLLVALLTGLGQLLYSIEKEIYTEEVLIDDQLKGLHLVVLMDVSGSMDNEFPVCVEAACQLIDGLNESDTMQLIAFAGTVPERGASAFLPMTADNKVTLQDMIRSVNLKGGTNFDEPLDMAINTLQSNYDPAYASLIIMLTDGDDSVDPGIAQILTDPNSSIELFTLRITDGSAPSADAQALINMAAMDFPIEQRSDGTVDVSAIEDAFQSALNHQRVILEEHERLRFGCDLLIDDEPSELWWRPVIQIVVFALYALLVSIAYYGKPGMVSMVLSLFMGAAAGWMFAINTLAYLILTVICLSAFTILEVEEVHQDV